MYALKHCETHSSRSSDERKLPTAIASEPLIKPSNGFTTPWLATVSSDSLN